MGIDPRDADTKRKAEPVMTELGRRFLDEYVPTHCKPNTQPIGHLHIESACQRSPDGKTSFTSTPLLSMLSTTQPSFGPLDFSSLGRNASISSSENVMSSSTFKASWAFLYAL